MDAPDTSLTRNNKQAISAINLFVDHSTYEIHCIQSKNIPVLAAVILLLLLLAAGILLLLLLLAVAGIFQELLAAGILLLLLLLAVAGIFQELGPA